MNAIVLIPPALTNSLSFLFLVCDRRSAGTPAGSDSPYFFFFLKTREYHGESSKLNLPSFKISFREVPTKKIGWSDVVPNASLSESIRISGTSRPPLVSFDRHVNRRNACQHTQTDNKFDCPVTGIPARICLRFLFSPRFARDEIFVSREAILSPSSMTRRCSRSAVCRNVAHLSVRYPSSRLI